MRRGQDPARIKLPVNIHGQITYIHQRYNNFTSSYSGENSLSALKSMSYAWSGTLFFGARLAPHTDISFNPEVVSGVPFSDLVGLGGFTNGEATKAAGLNAKFYSVRAFLRQTFNQEGDKVVIENDANQITQTVRSNRVVITAGQFSTLDIIEVERQHQIADLPGKVSVLAYHKRMSLYRDDVFY